MGEWRDLTECLVEVDLRIEDLDGWATDPEDVAELERLEELRDDLLAAVERRRISRSLRERIHDDRGGLIGTIGDPRD